MELEISKSFDLPSEGKHQAVIAEINDIGLIRSDYEPHNFVPMLDVVFVIEDQRNDDGEPMRVTRRMTQRLNKHSHLGRLLVAAEVPVDFKAVTAKFESDDAIGRRLQITIQRSAKNGFPDVVAFSEFKTRRVAATVEDAEGV